MRRVWWGWALVQSMKDRMLGNFGQGIESVSGFSDLHAASGAGGAVAVGRARGRALLAADLLALAASGIVLAAAFLLAGGMAETLADPRLAVLAALVVPALAAAGLYRRDLPDEHEVRGLTLSVAGLALVHLLLLTLPWLPAAPFWHLAVWPAFAGLALLIRALMRGAAPIRAPRAAAGAGWRDRLALRTGLAAKRAVDVLGALALLILVSPFLLVMAVMVMLDGGPALFGQMRVGRDGRRFRCLKFRTMWPDAQARLEGLLASDPAAAAEWKAHQKLRDDPRVTRVGRFLRETSLDELPQLLNVLRGEMSLVGPRPIMAPEIPGYPGDHAYYHGPSFPLYAACTPGITGLWQVSGRTDTTHEERIRLDGWYARNWSFWLDIVILLRTVRVILNRSGR